MVGKQLTVLKHWISRPYTVMDIVAAIAAVAVGGLILKADAPLADTLIGLFGVLTVVLRADSRLSFGLALICLVDIPLLTVLGREKLAENFAVYAFYFLAIGLINSLLESQPEREYLANKRKQFRPIAKINREPVQAITPAAAERDYKPLYTDYRPSVPTKPVVGAPPVPRTAPKPARVRKSNKGTPRQPVAMPRSVVPKDRVIVSG